MTLLRSLTNAAKNLIINYPLFVLAAILVTPFITGIIGLAS